MTETQKAAPEKSQDSTEEKKLPTCGLIMPISGTDDPRYTRQHWESVRDILERAVRGAGFEPRMVSDSDPTSIIQGNIVNNLYYDAITVCDVSSKNPNVMFELGMRLAFDKPVVIVKDDITDYIFDIGIIQHVGYPCLLDFHSILRFIKELSEKLQATHKNHKKDPGKYGFLQHFGDIKPQHLTDKDIDITKIITNLVEKVDMLYAIGMKNDRYIYDGMHINDNMAYKMIDNSPYILPFDSLRDFQNKWNDIAKKFTQYKENNPDE